MNLVEAKANVSFSGTMGSFARGRRYQVDGGDLRIKALVAGGYLSLTSVEGEGHGAVDHSGGKPVSGAGVAVGAVRPQEAREG